MTDTTSSVKELARELGEEIAHILNQHPWVETMRLNIYSHAGQFGSSFKVEDFSTTELPDEVCGDPSLAINQSLLPSSYFLRQAAQIYYLLKSPSYSPPKNHSAGEPVMSVFIDRSGCIDAIDEKSIDGLLVFSSLVAYGSSTNVWFPVPNIDGSKVNDSSPIEVSSEPQSSLSMPRNRNSRFSFRLRA